MMENMVRIDGIWYELNDEMIEAKVTNYYNIEKYQGEITIPKVVMYDDEEYAVTEITNHAFYGCSGLTTIIVPEGVISIGDSAFYGCSNLTSIIIPKSVTNIGDWAFYNCSALVSLIIPKSVTSIGNFAFDGTVWFNNQPDGLLYMGKILYGYKGIMSGNTSVEIKEDTISIGNSVFRDCSGLTSIIIPEGVTSIGDFAFENCCGLTSIIIPNSVTRIGRNAFRGCSSLTSIIIPEEIMNIGYSAFDGCSSLTSIMVVDNNLDYDSRNSCNAIVETKTNTLIAGCITTIIPDSVTSIEDTAFSGCNGLTSITIPKSVTNIGEYAFSGCRGLTSITIPDSVIWIGYLAFYNCCSLKNVYCYNFPKGLQDAFDKSFVNNITLHLTQDAIEENKDLSCFKKIVPIEAKVKNIELPTRIFLSEKSVHLLDQTITPSYATEQRLSWKSSNEEVAVVNSKGRVVALSSGTATITAMATDGSEVCASCEIVVRRMVESIQLNQTSLKLVAGNAFSLSATVTPKDAYDTSLSWSTTDDDIAMILGNGRVVAVSDGTATITAKANDGSEVTATCEVVVMET